MSMEPEVLFDKLASLEHYNDVAEFCKSVGIMGVRSEETNCALAKLFRTQCGVQAVRVCGEYLEWSKDWPESEWWDRSGWGEQRKMTSAMEVFIHKFDSGEYPALEEPIEDYE